MILPSHSLAYLIFLATPKLAKEMEFFPFHRIHDFPKAMGKENGSPYIQGLTTFLLVQGTN